MEIENIETTIYIDTKTDDFGLTGEKAHNGKNIDRIIVSSYVKDNSIPEYAVTYSKEDKSICGWSAVEEKGQLEFDVQIKFDLYYVEELILYNEILLFRYYERDDHSNTYKVCKLLLLLFKYAKNLFHTFHV